MACCLGAPGRWERESCSASVGDGSSPIPALCQMTVQVCLISGEWVSLFSKQKWSCQSAPCCLNWQQLPFHQLHRRQDLLPCTPALPEVLLAMCLLSKAAQAAPVRLELWEKMLKCTQVTWWNASNWYWILGKLIPSASPAPFPAFRDRWGSLLANVGGPLLAPGQKRGGGESCVFSDSERAGQVCKANLESVPTSTCWCHCRWPIRKLIPHPRASDTTPWPGWTGVISAI